MKLTIIIGQYSRCKEVEYFAMDGTVFIDQVISEVINQLPAFLQRVLKISESAGSTIFLTKVPVEGTKLHGAITLDELRIDSDTKLWLYCARLQQR